MISNVIPVSLFRLSIIHESPQSFGNSPKSNSLLKNCATSGKNMSIQCLKKLGEIPSRPGGFD